MIKKSGFKIYNDDDIIPEIIGRPYDDPFEIFIFNKKEKNIKIQTYEEKIIKKTKLDDYNEVSSAYCNGNNYLYISGGETKNYEIVNKLWKIDLKKRIIYDPYSIPPKKNHSMIFIQNNYIFFVGGNDKNTFYFDDSNLKINEWADLNKIRIEPALIKISNILYCFDNNGNDEPFTLEKTDLNSENPKWELLTPKIELSLEKQKFTQNFFGLSKNSDYNNIIFLGGGYMGNSFDNKNLVNYKYDIYRNKIEETNIPFIDFKLKEKTFINYNNNIDYILPNFNRENPEVIFYRKNKNKIEKILFKPNPNTLSHNTNNISVNIQNDSTMPKFVVQDSFPESILDNSQIKINNPIINNNNIKKNNNIISNIHKVDNDVNIKEGVYSINLNEKNNDNNLKNMKRPNSHRNALSSRINNNFNNELFIPKFHYNVNDPGNELIITKKNKIYNNYPPNEPLYIRNVSSNFNVKNENLYLPNYNNSNTKNNNNIIPQTSILPPTYDNSIIGNITYNNNFSRNAKVINNNQINATFDKKVNNNNNFSIEGVIPGSTNKNNLQKKDFNSNLKKENYELRGKIHGINAEKPIINFNVESNNFNNNEIGLNEIKPEINFNKPTLGHNKNISGIKIGSPKIEINGNNINNDDNYKLTTSEGDLNENMPTISISPSKINQNVHINTGLKNIKSQIDLTTPKEETPPINFTFKNPKIQNNINGNIPGVDINKNIIISGNANINEINSPLINIPETNNNLKGVKMDNKEYYLNGFIPGIKSDININGKRKINNIAINENMLRDNSLKSRHFPKSNASEVKGIRKIPCNSKNNFYGIIPGIDTKKDEKIDLKEIQLNSTQNISTVIPGNMIDTTTKNQSPSKNINNSNYNLKSMKSGNINSPKIEINHLENDRNFSVKSPKSNVSPIDINSKKPENITDFSLYGSIHGINIDSQTKSNYELIGDIPGNNSNKSKSVTKSNFYLKGIIPSFKNKIPQLEINNNIKMTKPDITINNDEVRSLKKNDLSNNNMNMNISNLIKQEENKNMNNINNSKDNDNKLSYNYGSGIFSEGETGSKAFSQRGTSKKKKKGLPLVGNKERKFEMSKIKIVGNLDVDSINLNNLRTANVGVNGVKIGDRIIE